MTEMIYSVDLIEEQIRVAMGEKLRYTQVLPYDWCLSVSFMKYQIDEGGATKALQFLD